MTCLPAVDLQFSIWHSPAEKNEQEAEEKVKKVNEVGKMQ